MAGDKSSPVEDNSSSSRACLIRTRSLSFSVPLKAGLGLRRLQCCFYLRRKMDSCIALPQNVFKTKIGNFNFLKSATI